MQSLISANSKSITETKMVEMGPYLPVYQPPMSFPPMGVQPQVITPYINISGKIAGKSMTFKFPAGNGKLCDASLRFKCTYAGLNQSYAAGPPAVPEAKDDPNMNIGFHMIRLLEIYSQGKQLISKTGVAMLDDIKDWKESDFQKASLQYSKFLNADDVVYADAAAIVAAGEFYTNVPILTTFLTQADKNLLLDKINDLELRVTFNDPNESGLLNSAGIGEIYAELFCETWNLKLSAYNQVVAADWDARLIMPVLSSFTEIATLKDVTTSNSYTISCPFLVVKTHLYCVNVTPVESGSGTAAFKRTGKIEVPVTNVTFNLNGNQIMNKMPRTRINHNGLKCGRACTKVGASGALLFDDSVCTIDWGVLAGRETNSGTAFFQELQGSNITVEFNAGVIPAGTSDSFRLFIVHEYFQTLVYDPSGTLSIDSNN